MHKFCSCLTIFGLSILPLLAHKGIDVDAHGSWSGDHLEKAYDFDETLANAIAEFFVREEITSTVDFGCGRGDYVAYFLNYPCDPKIEADGYDGSPQTAIMSKGLCHTLDLSQEVFLDRTYDWVVSLEVGEHIPKEYERNFFLNLHHHNTKGVILAWALIGDGGTGHFNEQNNEYVKNIMSHYGYINDLELEAEFRNAASFPWFKEDLMVFRKVQ